jgi:hypothetical protein
MFGGPLESSKPEIEGETRVDNNRKAELVKARFQKATQHADYRKALRLAKQLKPEDQLVVLDALFEAAERLNVDRVTGVPRVEPRGTIQVRGKEVTVEILR